MSSIHLTELLLEGKFTTVSVFFQTEAEANNRARAAAPAAVIRTPTPAPWGAAAPMPGDWQELRVPQGVGEMQQLAAAFPFVQNSVPAETYVYKVSHELAKELSQGDNVVVPDARRAGHYMVGKVWQVHATAQIDYESTIRYKWLVSKIDDSEYLANLEREQKFRDMLGEAERAKRRKEVRDSVLAGLVSESVDGATIAEALKLLGVDRSAVPELTAIAPAPEVK